VLLSLLFTLVDLGVLARRNQQEDKASKEEKNEGEEKPPKVEEKEVLSVHNTFMDVVIR